MATTYTASVASGYATDVVYADIGVALQMQGHFVAPNAQTTIIETGMFGLTWGTLEGGDNTTFTSSANANGTYAFIGSGLSTGNSGIFIMQGF